MYIPLPLYVYTSPTLRIYVFFLASFSIFHFSLFIFSSPFSVNNL